MRYRGDSRVKRIKTTGKTFQEITEALQKGHPPTETQGVLVIPEVALEFGIDTQIYQIAKILISKDMPEEKLFSGIKYQTIKSSKIAPRTRKEKRDQKNEAN